MEVKRDDLNPKPKRRFGLIGDALMLALIVPAVYVLSFGTALLQEKDTFSILLTAARLDLSGAAMGEVGSSHQRWLVRHDQQTKPIDNYMVQNGWVMRKPQGSVGVYVREDERNYIRFKPFTPRFSICQADRKP